MRVYEYKNVTKVHLRVPGCVRLAEVDEERKADSVTVRLKGALGHHVEKCSRGEMFFYGPLVMAPVGYNWSGPTISDAERGNVPTGYIPDDMPRGLPELDVGSPDADGLFHFSDPPLPDWPFFDEGPGAKCCVPGASANVPVKFADGQKRSLRFVRQCHFTSCLALHETPIVFANQTPKGG